MCVKIIIHQRLGRRVCVCVKVIIHQRLGRGVWAVARCGVVEGQSDMILSAEHSINGQQDFKAPALWHFELSELL